MDFSRSSITERTRAWTSSCAHPHEEVCRSAPWKNMGPRNRHCRAVDVRSELGCHENVRVFAVEHYIDRSEHDLGSCDSQVPLKYLVVFCALSV